MEIIITAEDCKTCEGTGMLVQDSGPMIGMTRPCTDCAPDYKNYINKYGTDPEENPLMFIQHDKDGRQMRKKITEKERKQNYLIMPDGSEHELII